MSGMMMGAAAGQLSGIPWTFYFNSKLTALSAALQRMNATYTRNSVKNVVQDGALVQLAANQFGTSYDAVTGLYGYVPEPAATNLCLYSEDQTNAVWVKTNITISSNAVAAPDGATTADLLTRTTTAASGVSQNIAKAASAITYTYSCYVKKSVGDYVALRMQGTYPSRADVVFNVNTGAIASAAVVGGTFTAASALITPVGDHYRVSLTATSDTAVIITGMMSPNSNGGVFDITDSVSNSACYAWGAQLETGSRATSYIATTGSTATRAADVLSVPLANIPGFTSAQYTLFGDCRCDATLSTSGSIISVSSDPTNRSIIFRNGVTPNDYTAASGSLKSNMIGASAGTSRFKWAAAHIAGTHLSAQDGAAKTTDAGTPMPAVNTMYIGNAASPANLEFNGYIFRCGLIPQALTQAQINAMTML
jgi:hypothetical protein